MCCKINMKKLDEILLEKCITQSELQRRAGIAHMTLATIRKKDGKARIDTIGKIANALKVKPSIIMKRDN